MHLFLLAGLSWAGAGLPMQEGFEQAFAAAFVARKLPRMVIRS